MGCDLYATNRVLGDYKFQFTHPVWGATIKVPCGTCYACRFNSRTPCGVRLPPLIYPLSVSCCFNSRTPCGVRLVRLRPLDSTSCVSIHAPRVGCDHRQLKSVRPTVRFNSRTPCGVRHRIISRGVVASCFNSRTPCGVRPHRISLQRHEMMFQFTHPVWGATSSASIYS